MTTLVFTKRLAKSGNGYLVWLPADIVSYEKITDEDTLECRISDLKGHDVVFTKHVSRSGRALLLWIPKDVTDFLRLTDKSVCQFTIHRLVRP